MPILKKALLVTTVSGFVPQFEMNNVRILQSMGYEVHYAANYHTPSYGNDNHRLDGTGIIRHQVDFVRSPFKLSNLTVYRQLCTLMKSEHFDLVHCHTPMGGVMARLAAHATGTGPVIYTAHGFHFFKGAAPVNWLCYYPMERFLSHFTDQQICINQEDYERASKQFHARYTDYIPGAGFDLNRIPPMTSEEIQLKKQALGLPLHCRILLSSGEFIKRKNHETTIRAFAKLIKEFPDIHYVICGHGQLQDYLQNLVKELGVTDHVSFPGYRQDMLEIYRCADIFAFPSFQEGLPMALLEAMASGLPVVCSDIRGSRDLMEEIAPTAEQPQAQDKTASTSDLLQCKGGYMIKKADNVDAYAQALALILKNPEDMNTMGQTNALRAQQFSMQQVAARMEEIYKRISSR
ncbi:glycosyltransferase family 4 protein [Clostridium sp. AF32-12BH]|uniref:glycosyltransferase family 4 protein n=1 Tax=Clostridium sp. AF32-12BH TaxID=2292006 RepID=UPI000E527336|nr:glycosyltransferase family 4 protein [Clostridium sp. AF32-12BH]RHP47301.1 glycosyltransferase family 1 protein [Clostridium sp. AF32-12BH]